MLARMCMDGEPAISHFGTYVRFCKSLPDADAHIFLDVKTT